MADQNKAQLWTDFIDFRIREATAYWSFYKVDFPFGQLCVFHEDDDIPYLKLADLTKRSFTEIVETIEKFGQSIETNIAFYTSSAWKGDVTSFEKFITSKDYEHSKKSVWFHQSGYKTLEAIPISSSDIRPISGIQEAEDIMMACFGMRQSFCDFAHKNMSLYNGTDIEVQYFGAYDSNEIIGTVGVTFDKTQSLAHIHCLGVSESSRGKHIAKHLVATAMTHIKNKGIKESFVCVNAKNKASLAVQQACGYSPFQTANVWKKKAA